MKRKVQTRHCSGRLRTMLVPLEILDRGTRNRLSTLMLDV